MTDLSTMSLEQLLDSRDSANHALEDVKTTLGVINDEIATRLKAEKLRGKVVGSWAISLVNRVSYIGVSLETAEALSCTKTTIDTTKLGKLYKSGVPIDGVKEYEYVRVSEVVDDEEHD